MIKWRICECANHECFYGTNNNYSPIRTSGPPCWIFVFYFLCCIFVCYIFSCCIKITSLSVTDSYIICLADFWSEYKEDIFPRSWENRTDSLSCDFPVFISEIYVSVSKLKFMLRFLLILLIFSLHKWYCTIRFSIAFHFHYQYIIKFIHHLS